MAEIGTTPPGQGYWSGGTVGGFIGQGGDPGGFFMEKVLPSLQALGYDPQSTAEVYAAIEELTEQGYTFNGVGAITAPDGQQWFAGEQVAGFAPQPGGDIKAPENPTLVETLLDKINAALDGLFGGSGNVSIIIPGLPVPIPGNMTFEDLVDMAVDIARNTGRKVEEVLDDILGGLEDAGQPVPEPTEPPEEPTDPPTEPEEPEDPTAPPPEPAQPPAESPDPNDDLGPDGFPRICALGRPVDYADGITWDALCGLTHNDDGSLKGLPEDNVDDDPDTTPGLDPDPVGEDPSNTPGVDPGPGDDDDDDTTPGGSNEPWDENSDDDIPGLSSWAPVFASLVPFALRDREERDPLTPTGRLMQARPSRRNARPDYGDPTPQGLFDFGQPVPQPTQVGYDPEPRREVISAVERERRRRMRRQGLL